MALEPATLATVTAVAARRPGLAALILFGSRARGDATAISDWDFGVLGDASVDLDALRADLVLAVETDRVDVVDLARAGGLLRFRAARDGLAIHDPDGRFAAFQLDAARFWCDAEPVLRRAYDGVLEDLGP